MPTTMSRVLALGVSLAEVIEMSTLIPARALLQEKELGSLSTGTVADVVISNIEKGSFTYLDVLHESRTANEKIVPETVI